MQHNKPKYNDERGMPQSEVDRQDAQLRKLLKDGLIDMSITERGGLVFSLTERGKQFNAINPLRGKTNE